MTVEETNASADETDDAPAIVTRGLAFSYPIAHGEASLEIVWPDMCINRGSFCALVGETGSGKTTLLRSLKPELAPAGAYRGEARVLGRVVHGPNAYGDSAQESDGTVAFTPLESAQAIGFVMQDPAAQIVCDTVWHELAFGLENLGTPQNEMRRRVAEVAHFFGIEPWVRKKTEDLSGGQKQLVNLASVLALRPRVLLLDEPTAQLDPNAVKQFLFLLGRVNRELGITVIIATHSPEDVEPYATQRIALSESFAPATRQAAEAVLASRWEKRRELFFGGEVDGKGSGNVAAKSGGLMSRDAAIRVRDLHFRFDRREPWVLRGIDLNIARGSVHAIVGGNGCGKTTLLRCMAGVLKPQRGSVSNALAGSQAMLPQDPKALFVCDSVAEELMEWSGRCGYGQREADAVAERFGLDAFAARHPYDLSGGQQQKLAIAKLLLADPQLLFLDEPTKGLDPSSCAELSHIVRGLSDAGKTIVLVTHDLDFALVTADFVSMPFDGEVACTEPVDDFFANNLVYRPNAKSRLFAEIAARG